MPFRIRLDLIVIVFNWQIVQIDLLEMCIYFAMLISCYYYIPAQTYRDPAFPLAGTVIVKASLNGVRLK